MKRVVIALCTAVAVLVGLPGERAAEATHPAPQPVLSCSDVNGDGPVTVGDIGEVVLRFGSAYPDPPYHPLYDVNGGDGMVTIGDVGMAVFDFGLVCPLVDTQIAQATLAIIDPSHGGDPRFLNEDPDFLASRGYLRAAQDLPGHGIHYVNPSLLDGIFDPAEPDGVAYNNGRLVSHVYYADGDVVGWGGMPEHSNQVDIDAFCTPAPPNTACSFSGSEDGWHDHVELCIWNIGTPEALVFAPISEEECESTGGIWDGRNGWMLHMHPHTINPNGRFANCFPDVEHWKGFNCPQ